MAARAFLLNPHAAPWEPPSATAVESRRFQQHSSDVPWFAPSSTYIGTDEFGTYNLWAGSATKLVYQGPGMPYQASWSLFAIIPLQHLQEYVGAGCLFTQPQQCEESWENSQWLPQLPCRKDRTAVAISDVEVSSTASGSASSLEDVVSDSEVTTSPSEAIDSLTSVPLDLFERLVHAGVVARNRGQHRRVRSPGGTQRLRLTSAMLFPQRSAGAPPPPPFPGSWRVGPCPKSAPPPPPLPLDLGNPARV